jgi:hypothetical protein
MITEFNVDIPWTCHICQREFNAEHGGICGLCNNPTCGLHLRKITNKKELKTELLCHDCCGTLAPGSYTSEEIKT